MPAAKKEKHESKSKIEICGEMKVKEAVNALKLLNKKFVEEDLKKQPLLEDTAESPIYLQLMLKKIPPPQLLRIIRVPLPHSLVAETSEVCLITGDLDKRNHKAEIEPTVLHYKDLLKKHSVTNVSQVIPLRQLRTEYKTFECKRQLAAAYDVFLVDKKVAGVMAKTLGKSFLKSRKFPIQIDMRKPNLKEQIDKALCQTEFSLTCRGNSYALEVARLSMEDEAIIENIKTCIEVLENKLPGKKENILSLYIKTAKSKAIPIYVSLDIPGDILIKKPRKNDKYKLDELSTVDDAKVKVFRDGRVILRKMKKESSSCEDENDKNRNSNEPFPDDDLMGSEEDTQDSVTTEISPKKKKKGRKGMLHQVSGVTEMESEEETRNLPSSYVSSKKKNKKNKNSSYVEADETIEDVQNSLHMNSRKRKIFQTDNVTEKAQKNKKRKASESEVNDKIDNNINSKAHENISEVAEEDINVKTPLKSKKEKKKAKEDAANKELLKSKKEKKKAKDVAANKELSSISIKGDEKTPFRSKKNKKVRNEIAEDTTGNDSLMAKEETFKLDSDVNNSLVKLKKRQKNDRKSINVL